MTAVARQIVCADCGVVIPVMTCRKRCADCQKKSELAQYRARYYRNKDRWSKPKDRYAENPGKYRRYHYKHRYGLTRADVEAMHASQGGGCAICRKEIPLDAPTRSLSFHVDHCHATGKVRGLLCRNCNLLLGNAGDSPDVLRASINYLEAACAS